MVTDSRRLAGVAGLVSFAFSLTVLPLYFLHSGAPPDSNVLTRILLGSLGLISLLVFSAAWGQIITDTASDRPWLSAVTTTPLVILSGLTFVHFSFEAGTVIATLGPVDPTREGVLAPAQFLLQGALGRLLSLAFLAGSAIAIMTAGFLPRWLAQLYRPASCHRCTSPRTPLTFMAPWGGERRRWRPRSLWPGSCWQA